MHADTVQVRGLGHWCAKTRKITYKIPPYQCFYVLVTMFPYSNINQLVQVSALKTNRVLAASWLPSSATDACTLPNSHRNFKKASKTCSHLQAVPTIAHTMQNISNECKKPFYVKLSWDYTKIWLGKRRKSRKSAALILITGTNNVNAWHFMPASSMPFISCYVRQWLTDVRSPKTICPLKWVPVLFFSALKMHCNMKV